MADDAADSKLEYPLLPLKNVVVFPRTIVNLTIGRSRSIHALNTAMDGNRCVVVISQKAAGGDEPQPSDLYEIGTLVEVRQVRRQAEQGLQVEVEALRRVRLVSVIQEEACLIGQVEHVTEKVIKGSEGEALSGQLAELFGQYAA